MTDINALYKDIEPSLMPIIANAANRVARSLREDPKDLIQDARIALFDALYSYDYNRSRDEFWTNQDRQYAILDREANRGYDAARDYGYAQAGLATG